VKAEINVGCIPERVSEIIRCDSIWIVWWWPEGDRKVAESNVEQSLKNDIKNNQAKQYPCIPRRSRRCQTQ